MGKKKKTNDDSIDYINGYPISEVWGSYHYLAREIAPRLKAFKALFAYNKAISASYELPL